MAQRLTKFVLPLACACALGVAAAPAASAASLTVGISDNSAAMFSNPLFNRINLTVARAMIPWNAAVMRNKGDLHAAQAWARAALNDHVQPMISFAGDPGSAGNYIPSTSVYTSAIRAFLRAVPTVKVYSPWNEPDWVYRPGLANNPGLAASYYNQLVRYCHGCTIVAGDLYLPAAQLGPWIRAYKRHLATRPSVWGLHDYYDVRTHTTSQLRTMLSLTSGQIWLTEISGVERRGHWQYANQSVTAAANDEKFLFSLPARFPRVTRIYHYQWQGEHPGPNTGWDSGLLYPNGTPRPAYYVVAKAAGKRPFRPGGH
ncbi:MAG TPA: glycosyl hydrolase [Solirubrobacteraceae bacterium]